MTQLEVYVLHFVYQQESLIACNLEPMVGRYIYENDVRISKTLLEYTVYLKSFFLYTQCYSSETFRPKLNTKSSCMNIKTNIS